MLLTPPILSILEDSEEEMLVTIPKNVSGVALRRNIREVMDETKLDESTLAAQRQEMERLRRVQEQQKMIRELQRQVHQERVISLLQGSSGSKPGKIFFITSSFNDLIYVNVLANLYYFISYYIDYMIFIIFHIQLIISTKRSAIKK